ncbi:MAG: hypothetical protein WDM86_08290 [Rhizomicrobium sp.]
MSSRRVPKTAAHGGDLLQRLQDMLYEYHDLGHFEEARPHILWLMEIAERETAMADSCPAVS